MNRVALSAVVALALTGQMPELAPVAAVARGAFLTREFAALFEPRQAVRLSLPRHPGLPTVRGSVAAATLRAHARRTEGWAVSIVRVATVEQGHGYVELERSFRAVGTQQVQRERILLSAVVEGDHWRITEVLIVELPASK